MNAREGHAQKRCGLCSVPGHTRKTCQSGQLMWRLLF